VRGLAVEVADGHRGVWKEKKKVAEKSASMAPSGNAEVSSTKFTDEGYDASSKNTMAHEDENQQRRVISCQTSAVRSAGMCVSSCVYLATLSPRLVLKEGGCHYSPSSLNQPTALRARDEATEAIQTDQSCAGSKTQSPSWTRSSGWSPKGRPPSSTVPRRHAAKAKSNYLDVNFSRAGKQNILERPLLPVMESARPRSSLSRTCKLGGKELDDFCLKGRRMSPGCTSGNVGEINKDRWQDLDDLNTMLSKKSEKLAEVTKTTGSSLIPRSARQSARGHDISCWEEAPDTCRGETAGVAFQRAAGLATRPASAAVAVAAQRVATAA